MREKSVRTFYSPEQTLNKPEPGNFSRSPEKPALLMDKIDKEGLSDFFEIEGNFTPLSREDFLIAHTQSYIDAFLKGEKPLCESNLLRWSPELVRAVTFQSASLYEAIKASIINPDQVTFSPTSGFHHAMPHKGSGFCSISGQVIAAVRIFRELGVAGAFVDLDAHFGNSIEDSREFVPEINLAVPKDCNINPFGIGADFIADFKAQLTKLEEKVLKNEIGYVVFCHGADSHVDDDLGSGQCTTEEWIECSRLFYEWVKKMDGLRGEPLPVSLSLFGGYRKDDFDSVLSLHLADLAICLRSLCEVEVPFTPKIKPRVNRSSDYE